MRISKSRILFISFFITLFYLDWFILKPIIKEKYLRNDIWEFENHSWIFSTVTFFIFLTLLLFYLKYKSKDKKAKWLNLIITSTLYSLVFTICLNRTTNRAMLYLNTNFHNKTLKQEYIIQRYDTNNVFQLFDGNDEIIGWKRKLKRIDSMRKNKNLTSIYNLKNNDTIIINYQKGFLKIKYLN